MSVSAIVLKFLAPAIAKTLLGSWFNDASLVKEIGSEIVDLLKERIPDERERKNTEKKIEQIAKQIAAQMRPIFEHEAANLDESSLEAIQWAIVDTLRRVDVTNELLMSQDLDAVRLQRFFRNAYPEAKRDFGRDELALYDRMLAEVSQGIIETAPQLDGFPLLVAKKVVNLDKKFERQREELRQEEQEFEQEYRNAIANKLDRMEVFGMPRRDELVSRQSLSVAHITLSAKQPISDELDLYAELSRRVLMQPIGDRTQPELTLTRSRSLPVNQTIANCKRIVIRGDAGAGKSTFLQWLAVRAAKQDFSGELKHWNGKVPFFIRLRRLEENQSFPRPEQFPELTAPNHVGEMPKGWVHRYLKNKNGQALVLIDGVDELPHKRRQNFLKALKELVKDFPDACYIVTSRPSGLKDSEGKPWQAWEEWTEQETFTNLTLEPMSAANVEEFVARWHEALDAAKLPEDADRDLKQMGRKLQSQLNKRPELRPLATNPLLCAMICALHHEQGETLPKARLKLYEECIEMLLNRRDPGRDIKLDPTYPTELDERQKLALIQSFAFWMMQNNRSDIELKRADKHFQRELKQMNLSEKATGKQIRAWFVDRAALLREPVEGRIDFTHRTFQEVLAAKEALEQDSLGVLLQHADDDQWRETLIVAAGLARPKECEEVLEELLNQGHEMAEQRHYLHLLAVACLETTLRLPPKSKLRNQVLEQARTLLPPKDEDEAKMVAKAGNEIVPLLVVNLDYSMKQAALCVQALAQIGSAEAMNAIAEYAKAISNYKDADEYDTLAEAIGKAWEAFDRSEYTRTVLSKTTRLAVPNLSSWDEFEYLSHLTQLRIMQTSISDISPLSALSNLTMLALIGHSISDISPVSALSNLTMLFLGGDSISDISPLSALSNLTQLALLGDSISDISLVSALSNLTVLFLRGNSISDISPLSALPSLTVLNLMGTSISDISPVSTLSNLTQLFLSRNSISDISPLSALSNLTRLDLSGDSISDISPLSALSHLTRLDLRRTSISDLSPLKELTNLEITGDEELVKQWREIRSKQ